MSLPAWINMKKLKKFREGSHYLVVCDSCQKIFLNITVDEVLERMGTGKWNSSQKWFTDAGYHWVENSSHQINVYLVLASGHKQPIFALSQQWTTALQYEPDQSKQAMINELKHLESLRVDHLP